MVEVEEARYVAAAGVVVEAEEASFSFFDAETEAEAQEIPFSFFDTDVEEEYFLEVDALCCGGGGGVAKLVVSVGLWGGFRLD